MDEGAARLADRLTAEFYEVNADSFAATRRHGWPGWERLLPQFERRATDAAEEGRSLRVLDLGCGTFRFERWLARVLPGVPVEALGLDRSATLAAEVPAGCRFERCEIGGDWELPARLRGRFDVAVAFGLLHHLPRPEGRAAVVRALGDALAPGGVACLSAWRFLDDGRLAVKAGEATAATVARYPELAGALGSGDAFLGWQGSCETVRFCHHCDEAELDGLVAAVEAREAETGAVKAGAGDVAGSGMGDTGRPEGDAACAADAAGSGMGDGGRPAGDATSIAETDRFYADGRSGRLNRYLVLERLR